MNEKRNNQAGTVQEKKIKIKTSQPSPNKPFLFPARPSPPNKKEKDQKKKIPRPIVARKR